MGFYAVQKNYFGWSTFDPPWTYGRKISRMRFGRVYTLAYPGTKPVLGNTGTNQVWHSGNPTGTRVPNLLWDTQLPNNQVWHLGMHILVEVGWVGLGCALIC